MPRELDLYSFDELMGALVERVKPQPMPEPSEQAKRNRERCDRMAEVIRELKAAPPKIPDAERTAIKRLEALGHPCAEECIKAIAAKSPTKGGRASYE